MTDLDDIFSSECLYSTEKALTITERKKLPDSAFGLPKERKYPLYNESGEADPKHIRSAMAYFRHCPEKDKTTLANNILKAARKAKMSIDYNSEWYKYTSEYKQKNK